MITRTLSSHTLPSPASADHEHNSQRTELNGGRGGNVTFRSSSSATSSLENIHAIAGTKEAVDHIVHDPIASGFLFKYCDTHFCSENMRFVIEIDRFQDQFLRDRAAWPKCNWKLIDAEIDLKNTVLTQENFDIEHDFIAPLKDGSLIPAELWPSRILSREAVIESLRRIWDTFLVKDATYWICIPSTAFMNTMRRIKMIHIYGKEVFMEALIDPIKTIEKDIYPRFLLSDDYRLLLSCIHVTDKPCATNLKLSKPPFIILQRYQLKEIEKNLIKFNLNDLIDDQILYTEFLKYLEKIVSSENLLCLRAIRIFKEVTTSLLPLERAKSFDQAWIVYRYFIASGAPYEISISYRKKKEVMRKLADPQLNIFDAIESSALSALRSHFTNYIATKEYHELFRVVISKRHSITAVASAPVPTGKISTVKLPSAKSNDENWPFFRTNCFSMR